ncbi:SSD domain-containing protein [Plasmodiophora brassicae]
MAAVLMGAALPQAVNKEGFVSGPIKVTPSGVQTWANLYNSILQGLPRFTKSGAPAPRHMTAGDVANAQSNPDVPYVEGVGSLSIIFMVVAVLSLVVSLLFCICRFCCNCCGKRRRTRVYPAHIVWIMRVSMLILSGLLAGVAVVGYNGNVGLDFTVDDARHYALDSLDRVYSVTTLLNDTASYIDNTIYADVQRLNNAITSALPSSAEIASDQACLANITSLTSNAQKAQGQVSVLNSAVMGLPDLLAVNRTLGQLDVSIKTLPDCMALSSRVLVLNASIATMPPLAPIQTSLTKLNATLKTFNVLGAVVANIQSVRNALNGFTTTTMTNNLNGFNSFWTNIPNITQLQLDVNINSGQQFSDVVRTYNELSQLNNATKAMPNIGAFIANIRALNTTKNSLQATTALIGEIQSLNRSLQAIPNLGGIVTALRGFKAFLATDFHLPQIQTAVKAANLSIAIQPSSLTLLTYMTAMNTSVAKIKSMDFAGLIGVIQLFNSSLTRINCIGDIIGMITRINTTLVILPASIGSVVTVWHDLQPQIANLTSQQQSMSSGVTAIRGLNSTLGNLPDFNAIIGNIRKMNSSQHNMPDLTNVYKQIADLNASLHAVPDMDTYINNTVKLNSSMQIANLGSTTSSLTSMQSQLNTMPALQPFVDNMVQLNATLNTISTPLQTMLGYLAGKTNPYTAPAGWTAVKTTFVSGLQQLQSTKDSRPNSGSLLTNLASLNSTITTMPDLSQTQTQLNNLNRSLTTFPDLGLLQGKVSSLQTSLNNQPNFGSLSSQLITLNRTVVALPNMKSTQQQVLDVKKQVDGANLNSTISQLGQVSGVSIDSSISGRLGDIAAIRSQANIGSVSGMITNAVGMVRNMSTSLASGKATYAASINNAYALAQSFEGLRMGGLTVLLLLPVLVSLLAVCSVVCRCGCGSMCMALIFMYMSFVYYLIASIFIVPAVFLSDTCADFNVLVEGAAVHFGGSQVSGNISALAGGSVSIPASLDGPVLDLVEYYLECDASKPVPALIAHLPDAFTEQLQAQVNLTSMLDQVQNGAMPVKFVPSIMSIFTSLIADINGIGPSILTEAQTFLKCQHITPLFTGIRDLLCSSFEAGYVVFAFSLLLQAVLMTFGICCGVCGFKRLQRQNRIHNEDDEDSQAVGGAGVVGSPLDATSAIPRIRSNVQPAAGAPITNQK